MAPKLQSADSMRERQPSCVGIEYILYIYIYIYCFFFLLLICVLSVPTQSSNIIVASIVPVLLQDKKKKKSIATEILDAHANPRMPPNLICDQSDRTYTTDLLSALLPCFMALWRFFFHAIYQNCSVHFLCLSHKEVVQHPVHFGEPTSQPMTDCKRVITQNTLVLHH